MGDGGPPGRAEFQKAPEVIRARGSKGLAEGLKFSVKEGELKEAVEEGLADLKELEEETDAKWMLKKDWQEEHQETESIEDFIKKFGSSSTRDEDVARRQNILKELDLLDGLGVSWEKLYSRIINLTKFQRHATLSTLQKLLGGELEGECYWVHAGLAKREVPLFETDGSQPADGLPEEYKPVKPQMQEDGRPIWEPVNVKMIDEVLKLNAMRQARPLAVEL